ncbi:MAG: EamA family transporter [Sphingobacteriales bacterium]|nr:MAG: EamA family transporter [Sphingobacteriales bacterium]
MGILFALLAALFAAFTVTLTKAGLETVNPYLAFAIQAVLILGISWSIALYSGDVRKSLSGMDTRTWVFILSAGICTTLSTVFSYRALHTDDTTLVVPLERLSLVLAIVLAVIFLKEKLTWQVIAGVVLMTAGAVLIGFSKKGG